MSSCSLTRYQQVGRKLSLDVSEDVTVTEPNEEVSEEDKNPIAADMSEIKRFAILGERHSGAAWLASKLAECFPELEVTPSLSRMSYWFQEPSIEPLTQPTLVFSIFLNAYDWVDRMRQHPIYAPCHQDMDWLTFVNAPWTMNLVTDQHKLRSENLCQLNFNYNEVIPCNGEELNEKNIDNPVYELKMDASGEAYKSILDLRADKIRNFLSTSEWDNVSNFVPIQYENLMKANGFASILEIIKRETGLTSTTCLTSGMDPFYIVPDHERISRTENSDYISWMNENIDWDAEELVGYEPERVSDEETLVNNEALVIKDKLFDEDGTFNVENTKEILQDGQENNKDKIEKYESSLMGVPEVDDGFKTSTKPIEQADDTKDAAGLGEPIMSSGPNWMPVHHVVRPDIEVP